MSYLILNGVDVSDYVKGLKIGYETLVSDKSGRNANGDTVVDVINRKVKIYVVFRPLFDNEMIRLLDAISNFTLTVRYRDARTGNILSAECYTGTPEPEYYRIIDGKTIYKDMSLNFIEL